MNVRLLSVPYDSGHRAARLGRGPDAFLAGGLPEHLARAGHTVGRTTIELDGGFGAEVGAAFALNRRLASAVRGAAARGETSLVLTGNCVSCVGTLAGVGPEDVGVLWFDAHADFNTPDTSTSGFLDGMAVAIATGECWRAAARTVPHFQAGPVERVVLVGARAFDPGERERFERAGGTVVGPDDVCHEGESETVRATLAALRERTGRLYVHIDLDVLDPAEGRANPFAEPGGLTRGQVRGILVHAVQQFVVAAAALSAYDPAEDADGRILRAGIELSAALFEGISAPAPPPQPSRPPRKC
jgi:arginase